MKEANINTPVFVLEWGRFQNYVRVVMIYVSRSPRSPQLKKSFIEVFAALVTLIGFVVLASVVLGVIACIILKLILDLSLGCVELFAESLLSSSSSSDFVNNLRGFFFVCSSLVLLVSFKGVYL
jgi:hypothetical protein